MLVEPGNIERITIDLKEETGRGGKIKDWNIYLNDAKKKKK